MNITQQTGKFCNISCVNVYIFSVFSRDNLCIFGALSIPNGTKYISGSVVPKEVVQQPELELKKTKRNRTLKDFGPEFKLYLIEGTRDEVSDQHSYCFNVDNDPKTFDEAMKSQDVAFWKEAINDEMDSIMVQVDLTKEFLSSRFSMKDMGEADVILDIRIKHESNGIAISQSHYIEKVVKKFNFFDYTPVSTPMDTSEKLMPNNGKTVSQLEYPRCWKVTLMQAGSNNTEIIRYSGWEVECLKNLLLKIPLWVKPIVPISTRCDSAATLAKAYSQMYNGKSRHLGVRHSMIRKLITNEVVFIEFVRSQQNLADHLLLPLLNSGIERPFEL
ncbi:zinc finger, CCHC-type containing protein [Tanacetum coccineum]